MNKTTINELTASTDLLLSPEQVAAVLGVSPQGIRNEASRDVNRLGFPVIRLGQQTLIPRIPFLRFLGFEL